LIAFSLAATLAVGSAAAASPGLDVDAALQASQAAIARPVGDYAFTNALNRTVHLSDFRGRPLVVNMVYTACADICPTVSESLADAVDIARDALGADSFTVVTVGFDARRDTPDRMRAYARSHGLSVERWEFLSGSADSVDGLANDIGFQYIPGPQGFDHVAQTTVIDAEGRVYRQIYGAAFEPPALVEPLKELIWGAPVSANVATNLIDRIRLICTVYDPASGRYRFSYAIFISIGLSGLTLVAIGWVIVRAWWKARRNETAWTKLKKLTARTPSHSRSDRCAPPICAAAGSSITRSARGTIRCTAWADWASTCTGLSPSAASMFSRSLTPD